MPPQWKWQKQKLWDLTLPGHNFLGPGTDLDRVIQLPGTSRLNEIVKQHDLDYENENITTEEADNKLIKEASKEGALGKLAATAINAKWKLSLDNYFRQSKRTKTNNNPPINNTTDSKIIMATNTEVQELDSGGAGGWQGTLHNNNGPSPTPTPCKNSV